MQMTVQTFGVVARPKVPEGYEGLWINIYKCNGRGSSLSQAHEAIERYGYGKKVDNA